MAKTSSPRPRSALAGQVALLQRAKRPRRARRQVGIQSLEAGIAVLKVLVDAGKPMKLKDIAAAARMSASKAHRYMVSFCRTGLAQQDPGDTGYRLGPYALEMAIAAFNALRPVKLGSDALEALGAELGVTVALAVWGSHGPTIVRIEESSRPVSMNIRAGTVTPVTRSASGLVFAAHLPAHVTRPFIEAEQAGAPDAERRAFTAALEATRKSGVATISQGLVPGADASAAPVFDRDGRVCLALLAVASTGTVDLKPGGAAARGLIRHADALSRALGRVSPPARAAKGST